MDDHVSDWLPYLAAFVALCAVIVTYLLFVYEKWDEDD